MTQPIELERVTITEALLMNPAEWDNLSRSDLIVDAATLEATAQRWAWLRGAGPDDADADAVAVRRECVRDAGLLVALNLPALEFVHWFRRAEWTYFDATADSGSEVWAWDLLDRARAGAAGMGAMALQQPLRPSKG